MPITFHPDDNQTNTLPRYPVKVSQINNDLSIGSYTNSANNAKTLKVAQCTTDVLGARITKLILNVYITTTELGYLIDEENVNENKPLKLYLFIVPATSYTTFEATPSNLSSLTAPFTSFKAPIVPVIEFDYSLESQHLSIDLLNLPHLSMLRLHDNNDRPYIMLDPDYVMVATFVNYYGTSNTTPTPDLSIFVQLDEY